MKLNLVNDIDLVVNPDNALIVKSKNDLTQLIMCCPKCGRISSSAGSHVYNRETRSYTPSIVHDVTLGGCDYHGWLTNGEFIEC